MITVEEAQALCLALARPTEALEGVPLALASGRVLRASAKSTRAQPPFASSAMDGYALRAADAEAGAGRAVSDGCGGGGGYLVELAVKAVDIETPGWQRLKRAEADAEGDGKGRVATHLQAGE